MQTRHRLPRLAVKRQARRHRPHMRRRRVPKRRECRRRQNVNSPASRQIVYSLGAPKRKPVSTLHPHRRDPCRVVRVEPLQPVSAAVTLTALRTAGVATAANRRQPSY